MNKAHLKPGLADITVLLLEGRGDQSLITYISERYALAGMTNTTFILNYHSHSSVNAPLTHQLIS